MLSRINNDSPQCVLFPIHLTADDREERFRIYKDAYTILCYDFVEFARLVNIIKMVRESSTPLVPDPDADELWCGTVE